MGLFCFIFFPKILLILKLLWDGMSKSMTLTLQDGGKENFGEENEAEQAHPTVGKAKDWKYHKVQC